MGDKLSDIYKTMINLIKNNHFHIATEEIYDAPSGWHGKNYFICDGDKIITDLSGNGYCFDEKQVKTSYKEIIDYLALRDMNTLDAFINWCDDNSKPRHKEK